MPILAEWDSLRLCSRRRRHRACEPRFHYKPAGRGPNIVEGITRDQIQFRIGGCLQGRSVQGRDHTSVLYAIEILSASRFEYDIVAHLEIFQNAKVSVAMSGDHTISLGAWHRRRTQMAGPPA